MRAILIVLVVVGHALAPASHGGLARGVYGWVYAFHMPAFVLVTGYLSGPLTGSRAGRLVTKILVPYVIFQIIGAVEQTIANGAPLSLELLRPRWTLWFLLALILWRLSEPLWRALQPVVALVLAIAISLAGSLGAGISSVLALNRVTALLPFFVIGLLLQESPPPRASTRLARGAGAAVLLALLVGAYVLRDHLPLDVLRMDTGNLRMGMNNAEGMALRLLALTVAVVAIAALLAVVPQRRYRWSFLGRYTLYVYLLHAVVLAPLRSGAALRSVGSWYEVVAVVAAALVLALALGSPPVRAATRWLVEPPIARWLLRRDVSPERPRPR